MTNIAGTGYAAYIRQEIAKCGTTADKSANVSDISFEQTVFEGAMFSAGVQTAPNGSFSAPDRWTDSRLYVLDSDTPEGYRVNREALEKVRERLRSEGIDADSRTPAHEITDEQMKWLGSRYDLDFLGACSFTHPDYGNFMLDLAYLNVFSLDEVENMYGVMPFNANHKGYLYKTDTGDGLTGFVDPLGGLGSYADGDDLYTELIMEYIKAKYTGYTDNEYKRMTADFKAQRTERMMIIENFFARAAEKTENSISDIKDSFKPNIENAFAKLAEDFGGSIRK